LDLEAPQASEPAPIENAEAELEEVAPAISSESGESVVVLSDRVPLYQLHKPNWGIELAGSLQGFGKGATVATDRTDINVRAIGFQIDYQPRFLQSAGVIGFGPSFGLYPPTPPDANLIRTTSQWFVGGQARYQLRLFREQPLVPMVGYAAEYLVYRYKGENAASGRLLLQGPIFGAYLLLNWLEPSAAADMFTNNGISRSYLVGELRMLSGSDVNVDVPGKSVFFGLRVEY
jgi:hypothetical protein